MANQEHLAILLRGAREWNTWRKRNRRVRPDLSGADLGGAVLYRANLSGADLSFSQLNGADLTNARLWGTDLKGANLSGADMTGAQLGVLSLVESLRLSLRGVIPRANPLGVDLTGADLDGVRGLTQHQLSASASYKAATSLPPGLQFDTRDE